MMKNLFKIAKGLWTKALALPGLSNLLVGLGIYALEQLVVYLKSHPKPEPYYPPNSFIEIGA